MCTIGMAGNKCAWPGFVLLLLQARQVRCAFLTFFTTDWEIVHYF